MKSNIARLPMIMTIAFLLNSCSNIHTETIIISDVGVSEKHDVRFNLEEGKNVYKIHIHVKGFIDDTVKMSEYFLLPEKVDTIFGATDWYSPDYSLDYKPYKAKHGELTISLEFIIF